MAKAITLREKQAHDYLAGTTHLVTYEDYWFSNRHIYRKNKYIKTMCGRRTLNHPMSNGVGRALDNVMYYEVSNYEYYDQKAKLTSNCPDCLRQHDHNVLATRLKVPQRG